MGSKPENRKICAQEYKTKLAGGKNTREISTQDAVENGMQETMSADLNATVLLVGYISVTALFCFKEGLEMFLHY